MVRSLIFFVVGLANLIFAVLIFTRAGITTLGIGILLIGLSGTIGNGYELLEVMKNEKARKYAGFLDEAPDR